MKNKKSILIVLGVLLCSFTTVKSAEAQSASAVYPQAVSREITVYSKDIIIKRYRTHNGKRQYRRWNKTKECWVDPKWIDM